MNRVKEEKSNGGATAVNERRIIRSNYLQIRNFITDKKDDITRPGSDNFDSIFNQVQSLHQKVEKPREQVADAETLLELATTLATSVRAHVNEGITPSDFVYALLVNFGNSRSARDSFNWHDLGRETTHIFNKAPGCCTMIGPINAELKHRNVTRVSRKRSRPAEKTCPQELVDSDVLKKSDTDKNMLTMFDILRTKKSAKLENLVLNRGSFAQTVENIFTLSFLVKEGRAEITLNDSNQHIVVPRNAPAANAVSTGQVAYNHFVFRFDCKDWKLMSEVVAVGDELMPHRVNKNTSGAATYGSSQSAVPMSDSGEPATRIRKLCRNRGLIVQSESVLNDSEEKPCVSSLTAKCLWSQ